MEYCKHAKYISEDFTKFFDRFMNCGSVSYEVFMSIWRELSFDYLYAGRNDESDCSEYAKDLLRAAVDYCSSSYEPNVKIMGLYLSYAIHHSYPYELKVPIRITLEEWKDLVCFVKDLEKQISDGTMGQNKDELYDVIYIFNLLRKSRCFSISATKFEIHPESQNVSQQGLEEERVEEVFNQQHAINKIFSVNTMDELSASVIEYEIQKEKVKAKYQELEKSLDIPTGDIMAKIVRELETYEDWKNKIRLGKKASLIETTLTDNDEEEEGDTPEIVADSNCDIAKRRKEIKSRALKSTPSYNNIHGKNFSESGAEAAIGKFESPEECAGESSKVTRRRHRRAPNKRRWTAEHSLSDVKSPLKMLQEDKVFKDTKEDMTFKGTEEVKANRETEEVKVNRETEESKVFRETEEEANNAMTLMNLENMFH